MQNTTIKKNLALIRSFLRFCDERNLIRTDWKSHRAELKIVNGKNVLFLTMQEFEKISAISFPENKKYLDRTRDVFCFQCMTSLRYSDVVKLKKDDIFDNELYSVTEKTDKALTIPLCDKAKDILAKYKDTEGEKALPVPSNQKMNKFIKEICYLAELNQPFTHTYFKGKERIENTYKKYELVGTHTARRTFICIALACGIPPEVIMRITGHSDYKSMQSYIDVTDSAKIEAVKIFDKNIFT